MSTILHVRDQERSQVDGICNASSEHGFRPEQDSELRLEVVSHEKNARDVERDLVRKTRGYHEKIAGTTTTMVRKPIAPGTNHFYQVMLREWDLFLVEYDGLHDPTNIKTAKDFVLYFTSGRRGRNEPGGRLTKAYAHTAWKSFMAAWGRKHHISFSKSHQDTILNFINGGEHDEGPNLTHKARPIRNFTRDDFLICVQQLWQNDWHDFVHERYRVGLHLLLLLHCNTSGRRAEYEKELRYGDIVLAVVWLEKADQPQLVIDFRRTKAKGLQNWEREQPQHMLYELVGLPFYCNSVAFFMAAALADDVLRDYHSWEEICAISKPLHQKHVIIEYAHDKCRWPLFPRSFRDKHLDHSRSSASLTSEALLNLGFRAGFRDNLTLHAARREVLLQVDNYGYSCNERMRFAAHINPNTYRRSYQTAIPLVDGQSSYFQYEPNNAELHALRRSYLWRRNPHHQPTLKEATRMAVCDAREQDEEDDDLLVTLDPVARQKVYDQRRQQRDSLLREQIDMAPPQQGQPYESDFVQTRKVMPERDRLAVNLFREGSLRDEIGQSMMADLVALCRNQRQPTYCQGLNASGSRCDTCQKTCPAGDEHSWWSHLYRCRKRSICRDKSFAEFCFLCFTWYDDAVTWQAHGQEHMQDLPLKCNMAIFRCNVVRPALCPACLRDKKFHQFVNLTSWKSHLHDHVLGSKLQRCPHPRCVDTHLSSKREDILDHLADVHEIRFESKKRKRCLHRDSEEHGRQKLSFLYINPAVFSSPPKVVQAGDNLGGVEVEDMGKLEKRKVPDARLGQTKSSTPATVSSPIIAQEEGDYHLDNSQLVTLDGIGGDESHSAYDGLSGGHKAAGNVYAGKLVQRKTAQEVVSITVDVPPVPDWWYTDGIPCVDVLSSDDDRATIPKVPESRVAPEKSRRGRPRGSRNRKTLLRERRRNQTGKARSST
ncbi:hypothetical protein LTR51_008834 [Lithohypha guttulata]|nr:hypothetical protein LTR51_008834 [Lithohypha guttulata]